MPVTALTPVALGHNVARDTTVGGVTADTSNFNGAPNNGQTIVVITTGATPGTVSAVVSRTVDGLTLSDVAILDQAGSALGANKTYVLGLGAPADYGTTVTLKATNALTKFTVYNVAV